MLRTHLIRTLAVAALSRQYFVSVAFALTTLVIGSGFMGCGGVDSGSGRNAGMPLAKADAVDVTYYYLPG